MSKRLEELKKGCNIVLNGRDTSERTIACGDKETQSYCKECQARIDEREKMEKEVKDKGNKIFYVKDYGNEKVADKEFDYAGDKWKLFKKELGLSEDTKQ